MLTTSLIALAIACTGSDNQQSLGPSLVLTQTTRLAETDSFFLGRPLGFAVGEDSLRYVVTDLDAGRVLAWNDSGQAVKSWGRVGRGPGEFYGPASVTRQGDFLWVADYGSIAWKAVRISDGVEIARVSYTGSLSYAAQSSFTDTLPFGLRDEVGKTSIGLLVPGDSSVARVVSLPDAYTRLADVGIGRLSAILPVTSGEWRAVGYGALDGLYLVDQNWSITDSVVLPRERRRGITAARIREAGGGFAALMNNVSAVSSLSAMQAPGRLLAVHYDTQVESEEATILAGTLYVTVIDLAEMRACVDARVPQSGEARPAVQVRGDTLFVLRQESDDEQIATFVDKYTINTTNCRWLSLGRGPMLQEDY